MKKNAHYKKYDITQCALYKCNTKKKLERLLCFNSGELKSYKNIITYHQFEREKKHSIEKRLITAPGYDLKKVQKRILYLLQKINRPDWLISGEKQKCYIDNGRAHIDCRYLLTIDIRKFYDHCKREPVYRFFTQQLKTSPDVAKILTDLTTYNGGIPTGCPTSQMIAYYAYSDMFSEIYEIAQQYGCIFTLYVDDMTFSSQKPFLHRQLAEAVDRILRKYGHKPKYCKIKYYGSSEFKPITGTVVTPQNSLVVPNDLQEKIYNTFQQTVKPFLGDAEIRSEKDINRIQSLKGQLQAARNIDVEIFPEITRLTNDLKFSDIQVSEYSFN